MLNDDRIKMKALDYLYSQQKKAKMALAHAELKPGVMAEEIENINKKLEAIDWLISVVSKED